MFSNIIRFGFGRGDNHQRSICVVASGPPGSGAAPLPEPGKGSESQVQKPTDPPMDSGPRSGSPESGITRGESTRMQKGTESRTAGGPRWSKEKVKEVQEALKGNGLTQALPMA